MHTEFASPADCSPDFTVRPETNGLDFEQINVFASRLRTLVLNPHELLGAPFFATSDQGKANEFSADGTIRNLDGADDIRKSHLAESIWYSSDPQGSGNLQFKSGFASSANEVYVPYDQRRIGTDYDRTIDDIVEYKTNKNIQVALNWENEFYPGESDAKIGVQKRYFFLSEQNSSQITDVVCVTVFRRNMDDFSHKSVYYGTFDEVDVLVDIDDNFANYVTHVSMEDIDRLERRIDRNIQDYKELADNIRAQKLGGGVLRAAANPFRRGRNPLPVSNIATLWLHTLEQTQDEHAEDNPADGINGNFSTLIS